MADKQWTVQRVLEWTRGYLASKGDDKARLAAEWLLANATGLSRVQLYTHYDRPLDKAELDRMHKLIERRAAGEPLQYVTGEMPFRHIIVRCESGVLIPRPETEILVDEVLAWLNAHAGSFDAQDDLPSNGPLILDLCTGSGCIALALAHEYPTAQLIATDIAPEAIKLAMRNAQALQLDERITFIECDLASELDEALEGNLDVVVSNPPYIPTAVVNELPREVSSFEPHLALDGGTDGLDVFRKILELAPRLLKVGGLLACELYEQSLSQACSLVQEQGCWTNIEMHNDLTGRPRIITAILKA